MDSVITIPALGDNFIYLYRYNQNDSFAVDPCDSSSVLRTLQQHGLNLKMILITHHHWDHVGGTGELKQKTGCEIIGADKRRIPGIDLVVTDGQVLPAGQHKVREIEEFMFDLHQQLLSQIDPAQRAAVITALETLRSSMEAVKAQMQK